MSIESERWENKRMGDQEGLEETGRLPIEAICRISDQALFSGYKIVKGFTATVRVATPQHLQIAAPGFAFQGGTPNLPIDLESNAFAHILAGTHGGNNSLEFGNGQAADGTNPRYVLVAVRHLSAQSTSKSKRFVNDTVQPKTFPLQNTNTRYNLAAFDGKVVHGAAAASPTLPDPSGYDGYVAIAVVYLPPNVTSLSDAGVLIFDTVTSTPTGAAGPYQPPGKPAFTPPWPTDVRSAPLDQRVTSIGAGNGALINGGKTPVSGPVTVTTDIIPGGGLAYVSGQLGVDYAQVMPASASLGDIFVWDYLAAIVPFGGGTAWTLQSGSVASRTFQANALAKFAVLRIDWTLYAAAGGTIYGEMKGAKTGDARVRTWYGNHSVGGGLDGTTGGSVLAIIECDGSGKFDLEAIMSGSGNLQTAVARLGYLK
ncbi:MAG: hypothetical protein HY816_19930 [Candidatus Wallbacteria bacterium]|nr:hypothetical protein [Candidatus Wallbacteria bacterium]